MIFIGKTIMIIVISMSIRYYHDQLHFVRITDKQIHDDWLPKF